MTIAIDTTKLNDVDAHFLIGWLESAARRGAEPERMMARAMLEALLRHRPELACAYCLKYEGQMHPPHHASPNCESGRRPHCSCDRCF